MYDALFSTYILVIVNINIYVMSGAFAILRITVTMGQGDYYYSIVIIIYQCMNNAITMHFITLDNFLLILYRSQSH